MLVLFFCVFTFCWLKSICSEIHLVLRCICCALDDIKFLRSNCVLYRPLFIPNTFTIFPYVLLLCLCVCMFYCIVCVCWGWLHGDTIHPHVSKTFGCPDLFRIPRLIISLLIFLSIYLSTYPITHILFKSEAFL